MEKNLICENDVWYFNDTDKWEFNSYGEAIDWVLGHRQISEILEDLSNRPDEIALVDASGNAAKFSGLFSETDDHTFYVSDDLSAIVVKDSAVKDFINLLDAIANYPSLVENCWEDKVNYSRLEFRSEPSAAMFVLNWDNGELVFQDDMLVNIIQKGLWG